MKKIALIAAAVLLTVALAVAASAAPVDYEVATDNTFDVSYKGTAGEYYAIVAVQGIAEEGAAPTITETSIQYIDQKTADASGNVAFTDILLKVDGTEATIYLGGSDLDEAILLGWVNKGSEETFTVSGTITSDNSDEATVTLTSKTDPTVIITVNTVAGAYTAEAPADSYEFKVTKNNHLSYTKTTLAVAEDTVQNATLYSGELTGDTAVDFYDLSNIVTAYDTASADYDLVGDNDYIDFYDLSAIVANYGKTATVEE